MHRYRKLPVVVEAMQYTGTNIEDIWEWAGGTDITLDIGDGFAYIDTLEGVMHAKPGDYIIRGISGELYPCKAPIFEATHEAEIG